MTRLTAFLPQFVKKETQGESLRGAVVLPSEALIAVSEQNAPASNTSAASTSGWFAAFSSQTLPGHLISYSARAAVISWSFCTFLLIGGGVGLLLASNTQVTVRQRYDDAGPLANFTNAERSAELRANPGGVPQTVTIDIAKDMDRPIKVYYELMNFYQNHKRYVRSVEWGQVHGLSRKASELADCSPQRVLGMMNSSDGLINPCGLIAWSYFNDTFGSFDFSPVNGSLATAGYLNVTSARLAWDTDRDTFFGNFTADNLNTVTALRGGKQLANNVSSEEHFMVWMRVQARPDVTKYWGEILDFDLKKGDQVQVSLMNRYNTYDFDGEKYIVLVTEGNLQGLNKTLPVAWLIMGAFSFLASIMYIVKGADRLRVASRREEKIKFLKSKLSWAQGQPGHRSTQALL